MTTFLLHFPTKEDRLENSINTIVDGNKFIKRLFMSIDRIDCENNTEIFIDKNNKDNFIDDYKTLESLLNTRIGSYSIEETILIYLSNNSIKTINQVGNDFDYTFSVVNFGDINNLFSSINNIRLINRSDFRHCENHPNKDINKSPLLGGTNGFDNAENLLYSAIGDKRTNKRYLINIDKSSNDFFIRFEDENWNNQYHAYHIVVNKNGHYIEDNEEIEKIKTNLKRAFKLVKFRNDIENEKLH
jgi:hypothetical protein